jgi:hypothetical protein
MCFHAGCFNAAWAALTAASTSSGPAACTVAISLSVLWKTKHQMWISSFGVFATRVVLTLDQRM